MGAYKSRQHSTTGISPHMKFIQHVRKKKPPQVHVRDVIRRQQEMNDLCRRNTQQAQARQKKRFHKKTAGVKAYSVGDYVWVFQKFYTTERNEETPEEVEGTIHDNRSASGGTFSHTKYRPSCAL